MPASSKAREVATRLRAAWRGWLAVLRSEDPWQWSPTDRNQRVVRMHLSNFNRCINSAEEAHELLSTLSRGKYLVDASLDWEKPVVGCQENPRTLARGEQWRLAMAWAGLEVTIKALMGVLGHSLPPEAIDGFLESCGSLGDYPELAAPETKKLNEWREAGPRFGRDAILVFLDPGVKKAKQDTLYSWLVARREIVGWPNAIRPAQALRHKTAHGALSANKTCEWGLRPAFRRLVADMGTVTATAFEKLAQLPEQRR